MSALQGRYLSFFQIFLHFKFGSMHGHSAGRDIRIWACTLEDDKVVAIVHGVNLSCIMKTRCPPLPVGTGDCKCILVGCCSIFCMLVYEGSPSHRMSLGKGNGHGGLPCQLQSLWRCQFCTIS